MVAVISAAIYIAIGVVYILYSDAIAAKMVSSVEQLDRIQSIKGIGFVVFMGLGVGVLLFFLLSSIRRSTIELSQRNRMIMMSHQKATAGIFASSIAHDINNYLSVIVMELDCLNSLAEHPEFKDNLRVLNEGFERLAKLTERLQHAGRAAVPEEEKNCELGELLEETYRFMRVHRKVKDCKLVFENRAEVTLATNPVMVDQAISNLIINAADVTGHRGVIRVVLDSVDGVPVIEVHDNGPGIPESERVKVLEPFYTTKETGTGLGLLSVKLLVELHNGELEIKESDLGGAYFRLMLPQYQALPVLVEAG